MATELSEALTAAGTSALIPKVIDPQLLDYQRRYSPLVASTPSKQISSTVYYFNQLTNRVAGGFVTDGGARPVSNSTYVQNQFTVRNLQAVGGVTGYAQKVTQDVIGDLLAQEIRNAIQGLYWDMETGMLWGNSAATGNGPWPQFDGLDTLVSQYSGTNQNVIDGGGNPLSLSLLNQLIDMVESQSAMSVFSDQWQLVGSNTAWSAVAGLFTNQQRFLGQTEVAAGLLVPTYRDIPLVKTSFLSTHGQQMGTVTATGSASGGSLAAGTYLYKVSAVMARQGEIQASAEVSSGALTGSTSQVTLAFTAPTGVDGAQPIAYKVYRTSGSTGAETLLGYVDAVVGTQADGVSPLYANKIVDTGATLIPQNGSTIPAAYPASYPGTNPGAKPPAANIEGIYLVPRDSNFLVRPYVRELQPVDIAPTVLSPDTLPFAMVADTCLAVRAPRYVGKLANVAVTL